MIFINDCGNSISLHHIELSGGHLSLVRLADLSRGDRGHGAVAWKGMLPAMTPHPIFSYARANWSVDAFTELPKPSVLNIFGDPVFTYSGSNRMAA